MPILAGLLSSFFYQVFGVFAARLSFNVAFAAAIVAVMTASFLVMKVALAAIWATLPSTVPIAVSQGLALVAPGNLATCITAIILTDVIASSWDFWKLQAGLVAMSVKA